MMKCVLMTLSVRWKWDVAFTTMRLSRSASLSSVYLTFTSLAGTMLSTPQKIRKVFCIMGSSVRLGWPTSFSLTGLNAFQSALSHSRSIATFPYLLPSPALWMAPTLASTSMKLSWCLSSSASADLVVLAIVHCQTKRSSMSILASLTLPISLWPSATLLTDLILWLRRSVVSE